MKSLSTIICITILPLLIYSQQRWEVTINDNVYDYYGINSCIAYDNGLLVVSKTQSNNTHVIKVDVNGIVLWHKTYISQNSSLSIARIKQNESGDIFLIGNINGNAILIMTDPCGNPVWCNEFQNSEHYLDTDHHDVVFLENGDIITLTWVQNLDHKYDIALMSFDLEGISLWYNPLNLISKYELLDNTLPFVMQKIDEFIIISGDCYYAYPDNPTLVFLRPMLLKIDNSFNEEWFLPYGMNDTILGDARGVVSFDGNVLRGFGSYTKLGLGYYNSILMDFDINGNEMGYIGIDNDEINTSVSENFFMGLKQRDDTSYFASSKFGDSGWENPLGEWIMDTLGTIYQYQSHENTTAGFMPLQRSMDNKYQVSYQYNYSDIYLSKLNADLTPVQIDTNPHNYDSLCNNLPIVSDTIYLDDCNIVTEIAEIPMLDEYYSSIDAISLHIFPNPTSGSISFEFENIEYHNDIIISCYDIVGQKVFEQQLIPEQSIINSNVVSWNSGIYIAIVRSSKGGNSIEKFIVK